MFLFSLLGIDVLARFRIRSTGRALVGAGE